MRSILQVASLQGYLLRNKVRPRECVDEVAEWVQSERETRAKMKKEKAEREAKEKAEREAKEKEEKDKLAEEVSQSAIPLHMTTDQCSHRRPRRS